MAFVHVHVPCVMLAVAQCLTGADATAFFALDADPFLGCVVASRASIHASIEALLQKGAEDVEVEEQLAKGQEQLRPTFEVLPRNQYGRLGSAGVRYLLHRHFLHNRAWLVRGLAPDGEAWGAHFPVEMLLKGAPEEVQVIVADHLKGRGLTLREVAVLASLLENHVHADAMEKLLGVWRAQGLDPTDSVNITTLQQITSAHVLTYLFSELFRDGKEISAASLKEARDQAVEVYPTWQQTTEFLSDTARVVAAAQEKGLGLGLGVAERVVMRVLAQYGRWQDEECHGLKRRLMALEAPSRPGRVGVADFYGEALKDPQVLFSESLSYMRQLGVLDEAEPGNPSVIIPNYINSPANHIISSRHFAMACIDECEDLLQHVERRVGASAASTEQLSEIVAALPSSSQPARTAIPKSLLQKLEQVAAVHGGQVPLHGRLFALWMHHAYPRECPHPHEAGTTQPLLPDEFEDLNEGLFASETNDRMVKAVVDLREKREMGGSGEEEALGNDVAKPLSWDLHEELLQPASKQYVLFASSGGLLSILLLLLAVAGAMLGGLFLVVVSTRAQVPSLDVVALDVAEAQGPAARSQN